MDRLKQKIVGLRELRENLPVYISAIDRGASFTVVRRSKPIFNITPIDTDNEIWEAVADFSLIKKGGVNIKDILNRL